MTVPDDRPPRHEGRRRHRTAAREHRANGSKIDPASGPPGGRTRRRCGSLWS